MQTLLQVIAILICDSVKLQRSGKMGGKDLHVQDMKAKQDTLWEVDIGIYLT